MKNIEVKTFYTPELQKSITAFNEEAAALETERTTLEADLAQLKADALSGDVDGLATLGKRRDGLKGKLLNSLIQSVKLAEGRGSFQKPIGEAYQAERVKLEEALAKRAEEVTAVFKKHGLSMRLLNGVSLETCLPLKSAVQEVVTIPKIEDDSDRALIVSLRHRISDMMA